MTQTFTATKRTTRADDTERVMPETVSVGRVLEVPAHEQAAVVAVWRREVAQAYAEMKELAQDEPDIMMTWVAGTAARISEMRDQSWGFNVRAAAQLRERHIDPLQTELREQFTYASRRLEAIKVQVGLTRGMT